MEVKNRVSYSSPDSDIGEINLKKVAHVFWEGKWLMLIITIAFSLFAVFYSLSLQNVYRSDVLLSPSKESQGRGLSASMSQLGGLASLAGINIGGGSSDDVVNALATIKSRKFLVSLVKKHNLILEVMAFKKWEPAGNKIIYDETLYDFQKQKWIRPVKPPLKEGPSDLEIYDSIKKKISVVEDKKSSLVRISVEHYSPYIAKKWADLVVEEINNSMRQKHIDNAERSIVYLNEELSRTSVSDMRTVFYQLVEEQIKTIMIANTRNEYVFAVIDPAYVPEMKIKPRRAVICVLLTLLGFGLGVVVVFGKEFLNNDK
ncbi:MAG: LPS O-antigen length regulator [Agarilytica sp.]